MRTLNPKLKIIVEIPTYPYFQEWNRIIDKPLIWKEKNVLPKIAAEKLVDYYLTLTEDKEIFGIPTILFDNCIDIAEYKLKENLQKSSEIHLLGVALLANWHGYDRVIKGLREYYLDSNSKINVFFHIVGDGPELSNLKSSVKQFDLEKYVIFEGRQHGEELDRLFDICNIGVGSLGIFRKGLSNARSLKNREYCARGIPFIKAGGDNLFDGYEYCLDFPNDDVPIEINKIVRWAESLDFEEAREIMREYAVDNFDWSKYIEVILRRIKE